MKSIVFLFANIVIVLICFIDYAITVIPFPPFIPLHPVHPLPPAFLPFSSCPWVIYISSLASTFLILFLPSPYLLPTIYATYSLYLFLLSPHPLPRMITFHVISISVILFLF